ncbi:MAG: transcriptional regulator/antitoxin, MazE [Candidatus Schekmanbacteria bacterium RBG_13_48_7]|uniref:Transcriptional regulator/antitoxin, MazE n=1 Tax=Candidatus Schekmanbacteria bacterium RBG_13_48_7 TaxID=1817878 RepID=A0A1F7RZC6_9BACT|nr:MAG: transcriptional regulator/antitoxin, MazE [Candidatus Schekmanbacteria bacterium RBG_13_48_7]
MLTKIKKWGNSQGLRFTKTMLDEAKIEVGDDVNITVQDGKIVITPVNNVHNKFNIKELVSKISKTYQPEEVDWGVSVGKEEW